jgi:hypothetical protein
MSGAPCSLNALAGRRATEVVERDDGFVLAFDAGYLLAPFSKWDDPDERRAMRFVRGGVLDVGRGRGASFAPPAGARPRRRSHRHLPGGGRVQPPAWSQGRSRALDRRGRRVPRRFRHGRAPRPELRDARLARTSAAATRASRARHGSSWPHRRRDVRPARVERRRSPALSRSKPPWAYARTAPSSCASPRPHHTVLDWLQVSPPELADLLEGTG